MANDNDKRLTTKEAAQHLGVNYRTLESWRADRRKGSPKYIRIGKLIRYLKSDLDEWLKRSTVTP